jgi:hypothetical protein
MIHIESDQPELARALMSLVGEVENGGGWFDESLRLIAEKGSIRVESFLPAGRNELLMSVPEELLLPVDEVCMRVFGDEIVIDSFTEAATPIRRRLFERMIEIYNLCGKIAAHRAVSPRFGFAAVSEVARVLATGRDARSEAEETEHDPLLSDFMHSRLYSHHEGGVGKRREVLLPVIDFFNHHPDANGFLNETYRHADHPVVGVGHWKPATDAGVQYGYLERGCRFVKSVPLAVDLEGLGKLRVRAAGAAALRRELPSRMRDLRAWMPVVLGCGVEEIELSHLIIPGFSDRHALRRVLAGMISAWRPGMDLEAVAEYVAFAERVLLAENISYYERLVGCLRSVTADAQAIVESTLEMATLQLGILRAYEFGE